MKKNLIHLLLPVAALFCMACGHNKQPISVFVNTGFINKHEVMINDTIQLTLHATDTEDYTRIMVPSGENTITVDGKAQGTYEAYEANGILNIAGEEFYNYPVEYVKDPSSVMGLDMIVSQMPVVFNSFVVYDKMIAKNQTSLLSVLKSNKLKRFYSEFRCRKIYNESLYIGKNWDIGIHEAIPKATRSKSGSVTKDKIISGQHFLLLSQISDKFIVEEIEDKELTTVVEELCEKYKQ